MRGPRGRRWPGAHGAGFALLAALCFGVSTPLVQRLGMGIEPWTTAGLLYAGAACVSLPFRRREESEAPVRRHHLPRLVCAALSGAVLAPAALAWGLQHTSGFSASLLLNFEVVFTVLLAWVLYREHISRRVALGVLVLALGGGFLVLDRAASGASDTLGLLAVLVATAAWAVDNAVTRPLADVDPGSVVVAKASLGAAVSLVLGALFGEALPSLVNGAGLLAVGAMGYGLSLRFYLLAQRKLGAARTTSVFAAAPFLGALFAAALGERPGPWTLAGLALTLAGVLLHVTEEHEHPHLHPPLEHEHAHDHDADHHDHGGECHPCETPSHSHRHQHEPLAHDHPHMPDLHHGHDHEAR